MAGTSRYPKFIVAAVPDVLASLKGNPIETLARDEVRKPLTLADAVVDVVKRQRGSSHDQFCVIVGGRVVQLSHASAATLENACTD